MTERRPQGALWSRMPTPSKLASSAIAVSIWGRRKTTVISALEMAEYPTGGGVGPQWHISIAGGRGKGQLRRVTSDELRVALTAFGMVSAEEDNHHPGNARHFWMPVDPSRRVDCECKTDEKTIVETDGYRWTTPHDGPCRGCEFELLTNKACPVHGQLVRP